MVIKKCPYFTFFQAPDLVKFWKKWCEKKRLLEASHHCGWKYSSEFATDVIFTIFGKWAWQKNIRWAKSGVIELHAPFYMTHLFWKNLKFPLGIQLRPTRPPSFRQNAVEGGSCSSITPYVYLGFAFLMRRNATKVFGICTAADVSLQPP